MNAWAQVGVHFTYDRIKEDDTADHRGVVSAVVRACTADGAERHRSDIRKGENHAGT